jgi:hypothetical protein
MCQFKNLVVLFLIIVSCSENKIITLESSNFKASSLSEYLNDETLNIQLLDSSSIELFNSWNQIIMITSKFNSFDLEKIDHKSVISSIKQDLEKITTNNIPPLFNRPEIIGRLRVLKTFVYKIDSYNLNYENIEMYESDLRFMFSSYDALVSKMNSIDFD